MTYIKRLLVLVWLYSAVQAQTWRSSLYPANWTPSGNFYTDKIIQDFSWAGYHRGEKDLPKPSTNIKDVTVAPYLADKTGKTDVTSILQKAINDVAASGGGVVYLPAGTYKVSPGSGNHCLLITGKNVVLRGAGSGKTFILNSSYKMSSKSIIKVSGPSAWYGTETGATTIIQDLTGPTRQIPVQSASGFKVGDIVVLRNHIDDRWITEHQMSKWIGYSANLKGQAYCREILAIDAARNIITIDAPIRYSLLKRDNPTMFKVTSMLSEIGIEGLSIGNVQHPSTTGYGEEDYSTAGTAAYDCHASSAILCQGIYNSWIYDVSTFQPAGNTSTAHLLSNGIVITQCKNMTIQNCNFSHPQYGGGGGNGYMYRISANETLVKSSIAHFARHGFVFASMTSSGNVIFRCTDSKTGSATGSSGYYQTSGNGSDHHMHFSTSNLIDQCTTSDSYFAAGFRNYGGNPIHGITAAHTLYWNMTGNGTKYTHVVHTQQARYGYVIGTSGNASGVKTGEYSMPGSSSITAPVDHVEGVGTGATLSPQSLYSDQLSKRLNTSPCASNNLPTISLSAPALVYTAPASIVLNANASDLNGAVSSVTFYSGSTLLGTRTASPYTLSVANVVAGSYTYTAKVTDNCGAVVTSAPLAVQVSAAPVNKAPILNITAPANNASYTAPANVNIIAEANDVDGSIAKVEFLTGSTVLFTDLSEPYAFGWSGVTAGTYTITVKATDNKNAVTTSMLNITVNPSTTSTCTVPSVAANEWIFRNNWSDQNNGGSVVSDNAGLKITQRAWGLDEFWIISNTKYAFTAGNSYTISLDVLGSTTISLVEVGLASSATWSGPVLSQSAATAPTGYTANTFASKSLTIKASTTGSFLLAIHVKLASTPTTTWSGNLKNIKICKPSSARFNEEQNTEGHSVQIYPNPVHDQMQISGEVFEEIKILDNTGRLVFQAAGTEYVDLSSLPQGLYHVQLRNGSDSVNRIIIKE